MSTPGINPPVATYYFSDEAWRLVGDPATDRGDDPLLADSYFVVRNLNGAPTLPLVTKGNVLLSKVTVPLMTNARSEQDNPVALLRPLSVTLNATGLNPADRSFVAGDQLLLFNNSQVGYDKNPTAYYLEVSRQANVWRLAGDTVNDHGGDAIAPGTGFVIRKAATRRAQPAFWTNSFVPFGSMNPAPLDTDAAPATE